MRKEAPAAEPAPFPTTESTCDGTLLDCNLAADPCTTLDKDSCVGVYHNCGTDGPDNFLQCHLEGDACKKKKLCYEKCTGTFVESVKDERGALLATPTCASLGNSTCQEHYVAHKQQGEGSLGMRCKLKAEGVCIDERMCAMQAPPDSFQPAVKG
eukprot:CAMPEP_0197655412 /NCGR_PEP_ID=MMETSP1338-20131121/39436_1 /TAXON_ID=43686 ORGANISM="Pelagodinium beii, Strain RCC1491" /NCGR_SAMPLE_ID=MMETSP1338 /ASSEMBLY_ACC=CAM_ASM_000754 /LENGTH=154 /DNA_ID=CAMNT_0043231051 /DNA_START=151 /DNA_END=615 /DNA_ORIENTATION=-